MFSPNLNASFSERNGFFFRSNVNSSIFESLYFIPCPLDEYIWLHPTTTLSPPAQSLTLYPIPANAVSACNPDIVHGTRPDFTYIAKETAHII